MGAIVPACPVGTGVARPRAHHATASPPHRRRRRRHPSSTRKVHADAGAPGEPVAPVWARSWGRPPPAADPPPHRQPVRIA